MKMAGSLHPPFSLFLPEEKEKTGRARSKREKEVRGNDAGARLNDWPKPGMTSPRRSQTGAGATRLGVFLFPLSLAWSSNRLGFLSLHLRFCRQNTRGGRRRGLGRGKGRHLRLRRRSHPLPRHPLHPGPDRDLPAPRRLRARTRRAGRVLPVSDFMPTPRL